LGVGVVSFRVREGAEGCCDKMNVEIGAGVLSMLEGTYLQDVCGVR
jgi:hypothetical protein